MNNIQLNKLYKAILCLQTIDECQNFFEDLCTIAELKAMGERWNIAQKINNGSTFRAIAKEFGTSTATITRVAKSLHHGKDGYKLVLHRLK